MPALLPVQDVRTTRKTRLTYPCWTHRPSLLFPALSGQIRIHPFWDGDPHKNNARRLIDEIVQGPRRHCRCPCPDRWVLKAILALAFALIAVAALSRLLKVTALLFGFPRPIKVENGHSVKGGTA